MTGSDFTYGDYSLSDFGFVMVKPDEEDNSGLEREVIKSSVTFYKSEPNHYGTKYTDPMILNFLIVKNPCTYTNPFIDSDELRDLQRWLTMFSVPKLLYIEQSDDELSYEYMGVFTNITPYYVDGLIGLNLQFTCNSPFAYIDKKFVYDNMSGVDLNKLITCECDENDYTFPVLKIEPYSDCEISIENKTDSGVMRFNAIKGNTYIFDCLYKRILVNNYPTTLYDIGFKLDNIKDYNNVSTGIFKLYWLRLLPFKKNEIVFKGSAKFTINFKARVKVGGLYV